MALKILHILHDEKFIDVAIDIFNSVNCINTYVSIDDNKPFSYIKKYSSIVQIEERSTIVQFIINGGYQIVAFHTLTRDKYELVLEIPKQIKIIWFAWGYDIYQPWNAMPAVCQIELYKPLTKNLITPKVTFMDKVKRRVKKLILYKKYRNERNRISFIRDQELKLQQKLLSRIDYMSTVLPSEFEMLSKLNGFNAKYFPFQYSTRKNSELQVIDSTASKILLGNSATPTNNHLDIITILKKRDINNECIIPCSYGSEDYLSKIKSEVKEMSNLSFLESFLPMDEYISIMNSCRVGIFGHIRQQAIGNIIMCMLQGSKIYLWRDSVAYKFFKKEGYIVFNIDDELTKENVNTMLSKNDILVNRNLVLEHFDFVPVVNRLNNFINEIS